MEKPKRLLNNLTTHQFLTEYWQKKPLLIKQAIPDFEGLLTPNELAGLACEEEVQSRIVLNNTGAWEVMHGPFEEDVFNDLPEKNWSLLVQSVNHHLPEAAALLNDFNFIPYARLDDLMISYAPTGGSVGPHTDAYDVFLLQGSGKRRWKLNFHPDLAIIEGAPLAILQHFNTEQEWVLEKGDMLYLPPNIAHYGISEDDLCMTYSIGFRAPKTQEITQAFLEYLQDNLQLDGLYEDADLIQQKHPAEISQTMVDKVETMLQSITWDKQTVSDFLGRYISEPKPDILFEPADATSVEAYINLLALSPLRLNLKSQMLFQQSNFYLNGESLNVPSIIVNYMRVLADARILDTTQLNKKDRELVAKTLHAAYQAGYVHF